MSDKKKKSTAENIQRSDQPRVGDQLREAREARGLSVEDISSAINIRAAQIRAIEEGHIEALPGMIYAVGFVKSYANYLKLDAQVLSKRFKAENGGSQAGRSELHFPEPIGGNKMPSGMMIGLSVVGIAALVTLWAVFTGDDTADEVAAIPEAPAIASAPAATISDAVAPTIEAPAGSAVMPEAPAVETPAAEQQPVSVAAAPPPAAVTPEAPPVIEAPATIVTAPAAPPVVETPVVPPAEEINIRPKGSRIVITAVDTSWIQVNGPGGTLVKKVLKPGEKYYVPDQQGLSLITSNAGGVAIFVDGEKAPDIGRVGEIRRGVVLEPSALKKRRVRVNNY